MIPPVVVNGQIIIARPPGAVIHAIGVTRRQREIRDRCQVEFHEHIAEGTTDVTTDTGDLPAVLPDVIGLSQHEAHHLVVTVLPVRSSLSGDDRIGEGVGQAVLEPNPR